MYKDSYNGKCLAISLTPAMVRSSPASFVVPLNLTGARIEQCQKGTKDMPGNPDCQAGYGTGALALALMLSNFVATVFLQQFNNGFPMTIKEMAAAFYVTDSDKKGDGNDKMAIINCHNNKGTQEGIAGVIGADDPKVCNKPEFKLNR